MNHQILFFFSALGAFNSVLLSIYFLFFDTSKNTSKYFLAGLLTALSIRIWKSLFFYFNPEISKIYLQIGLSACFFIGPFLYFYIKSKTSSVPQNKKSWGYQLLFLCILSITIGIVYPYQTYPELWVDYFYKIINYQWLIFIVISTFLIKNILKKTITKNKKLGYNDLWVLSVYFGVFLIWIAYFTASYTSYIVGALSFSFAFYLSALLIFYKKKQNFITSRKKEKYASSKIEAGEADSLLQKVQDTIYQKELYRNPNLTLPQLAKELNMRSHLLSQLLNDNLNKSFSQFINEYRIRKAKTLLKKDRNLKIEIIAENCGFNSNSTFYSAFKKNTGTTPAKYAKT
ncbi:helix-turn-helix transcriptional regulator [Aquimarina aquimarini]|uniref:helix-turn-helix transcriptional regulator n=1 Tax=Aquimarina aquimarini TaxID=1191734 RepID=UPI001F43CE98|nr:helix-turn-helix transcriptional regulator [Aquimarina aquimarini]